jgi:hypothetical protein
MCKIFDFHFTLAKLYENLTCNDSREKSLPFARKDERMNV